MKATSLTQYIQEKLTVEKESKKEVAVNGICQLVELYSKQFKPAMILVYFEGWESPPDDEYTFCAKAVGTKFYKITAFTYEFKEHEISYRWEATVKGMYDKGKRTLCSMPLTLDMFISDCSRAGIELKWKQKIIDNYFN